MKLVITFILSLVLMSCTHYSGDNLATKSESGAGEYVVIRFPPGKDRLLESEKAKIRELRNAIRRENVNTIEVLVWSDQEYPVEGVAKPSDEEKKLAADRGHVVKEYLQKDLGSKKDIDVHNMAQEPELFAKIFESDDFRLKNSLDGSAEIGIVSDNKESKAVILIKYE